MRYLYSTYVESEYSWNVDAEIPDCCYHGDNILIAAESLEEANSKVEAWIASKRRFLYRMNDPFALPRRWFLGGWHEKKKGWRWYETNACGTKKNGKLRIFYGYIFAPNKKFVANKLKEMGYPCIALIYREDWSVYIK